MANKQITETAARMISSAVKNTVLITEISTADAYERYYREVLSSEDMSAIARITGAKDGKLDPLTKFAFEFVKQSRDKESAVISAIYFATKYKQLINSIQREDIRRKVYDGIKQCKTWPDVNRLISMAKKNDGDRNEIRRRMEAIYTIYEDQRMSVIAPLTFESAKHYGGHSDWCTSKHERDFYKYCNDGQWIVMILFHDKDDEFTIDYQISMRADGTISFMKDENDDDAKDDNLNPIGDFDYKYHILNKIYNTGKMFDKEFGSELRSKIASNIQEIIKLGMEWKNKKEKTE